MGIGLLKNETFSMKKAKSPMKDAWKGKPFCLNLYKRIGVWNLGRT